MLVYKYGLRFYDQSQFNERGSVIITALLFMALATAIVVAVAFKQSLNLTQTQLIFDANKLWLIQKSMEAEAEKQLAIFLKKPGMYTEKNYTRAKEWKPIVLRKVIDGINFKTTILDAQAYFNINSLRKDGNKAAEDITTEQLFKNILESRLEDNSKVEQIMQEACAYVTPKSIGKVLGENHLPMSSITELRLLSSINSKLYVSLFKGTDPGYLFALPVTGSESRIKMNINTISSNLLSILLPEYPIKELKNRPFKKIEAVGKTGYTNFSEYFDIKSTFFLLKTEGNIRANEGNRVMYSLIQVIDNSAINKKQFQLIWFSEGTV